MVWRKKIKQSKEERESICRGGYFIWGAGMGQRRPKGIENKIHGYIAKEIMRQREWEESRRTPSFCPKQLQESGCHFNEDLLWAKMNQVLKYSGHHSSKFNFKFNFKLIGKREERENGHCCIWKFDNKQSSLKYMPMIFFRTEEYYFI